MTIRGPLISPIARPRIPQQPGILTNLLLSTLAPVSQAPFRQQQWPNPARRIPSVQPWNGLDLLQTTLAPAGVVQAPLNQRTWLNPQRAGLQPQCWLAGNLLQTTLAPVRAPFNQIQWPNPVRANESLERHVLYGISYFPEADPPPPGKVDFQNPVIKRCVQQPQVLPNLVLGTLFTAPTVPRVYSERQNPVIGRKPQQPDIFPNLVLGPLFAAPATPRIRSEFQNPVIARKVQQPDAFPNLLLASLFTSTSVPEVRREFQNPVLARRVQQPEVFQNLGSSTLFVAPPMPFRQQEWPNPAIACRQNLMGMTWTHFGQLTAPPTPFVSIRYEVSLSEWPSAQFDVNIDD